MTIIPSKEREKIKLIKILFRENEKICLEIFRRSENEKGVHLNGSLNKFLIYPELIETREKLLR